MIFEEKLQELIDKLENSLACMLMGFDGISVVSITKPGIELDLELMGAEVSAIVNQLLQSAYIEEFGKTREMVFRSNHTTILLHVLTKEYFIVLVTRPEAHIGKGRFLLKTIEDQVTKELEV